MRRAALVLAFLTMTMVLVLPFSPVAKATSYITTMVPDRGKVGTIVVLTGGISCGNPFQVYWDSVISANLLAQGIEPACSLSTELRVPETSKGKHRVILRDVAMGSESGLDFEVLPTITPSPTSGVPGNMLSVSATGFGANETDIQLLFDGLAAKSGITADAKGSFSVSFPVPEGARGDHLLQASSPTTTVKEVGAMMVRVTPGIVSTPASGGSGTTVTVSGVGFASGEQDVKVTFDGTPVKTGIVADTNGSFKTSFTIPAAIRGEHTISASGILTRSLEMTPTTFVVGPALIVQPTAGKVNDKVIVTGSGFAVNEQGIRVLYDTREVATGIVADANGAWVASFVAPVSSAGTHSISAAGSSTSTDITASPVFVVSPYMEISPVSGDVGTLVAVSGTGMGRGLPLVISYDDIKIVTGVVTSPEGSFGTSFKVPATFGSKHTVAVVDNSNNRAATSFTTETNAPQVPTPLSPAPSKQIGFVGSQVVTFSWSQVADPSGVSYVLQIGRDTEFNTPLIQHKGLVKPEYTLAAVEALNHENYFWRVEAIDGAGNESGWTKAQPFSVSKMGMEWFLVIVIGGLIVLALIVWRIIYVSMHGGWSANE